jgi:hypothetical protein
MSLYIVPSMALARVAKQNISWTAQALWGGHIQSPLARARTISVLLLLVDAVLKRCQCIWPLSVALEYGRWEQINAEVSPGIVVSLVLVASAGRSVATGGDQRS